MNQHVHDHRPMPHEEALGVVARELVETVTEPGEATCNDCVRTLAGRFQIVFEDFTDEGDE